MSIRPELQRLIARLETETGDAYDADMRVVVSLIEWSVMRFAYPDRAEQRYLEELGPDWSKKKLSPEEIDLVKRTLLDCLARSAETAATAAFAIAKVGSVDAIPQLSRSMRRWAGDGTTALQITFALGKLAQGILERKADVESDDLFRMARDALKFARDGGVDDRHGARTAAAQELSALTEGPAAASQNSVV